MYHHSPPRSPGPSRPILGAAMSLALMLAGCDEPPMADLIAYSDTVKARPGSPLEPLCQRLECASLTPDFGRPDLGDRRGPFDPFPMGQPRTVMFPTPMPDPHPTEALERFPLDSLRLLGSVEKDGQRWGLLRAPDGVVHRVATGHYVGLNNGKVVSVTEGRVSISELVWNDATGWEDRAAELALGDG